MSRLLDAVLRPRRALIVPVVGVLLALFAIIGVGEAEREPTATDALPDGYASTEVTAALEAFPQGDDSVAIVLFSADSALSKAQLGAAQDLFGQVAGDFSDPAAGSGSDAGSGSGSGSGSTGAGSGAPAGDPTTTLVPSEDGTAAIGIIGVQGAGATEIAATVGDLREALDADVPDGVTAEVTGPAAIQADLAAVFDGADFRLLGATATVVAILLILTYRSPVLWLIPLTVVGLADRAAAALSTQVLDVFGVAWDESTVGILSVLVFGAGTDYALLLISRYRDELRRHEDRYAAMRTTVRRTVEPVLASATTVVVGLLILLLSAFPTTRGLGLACAVGVVIAAVAALVFLPFTLVLAGRWVFWPRSRTRRAGAGRDPLAVAPRRRPGRASTGRVGRRGDRGPGRHGAGHAAHRHRPVRGRPVPRDPGGDRGRRAAGRVLPGGQLRPDRRAHRPTGRGGGVRARERPGRRLGAARRVRGGGEPARRRARRAGRAATRPAPPSRRCATRSATTDRSGAPRRSASTSRRARSRDRLLIIPLILGLVLLALVPCCARSWRRSSWWPAWSRPTSPRSGRHG